MNIAVGILRSGDLVLGFQVDNMKMEVQIARDDVGDFLEAVETAIEKALTLVEPKDN